MATAEAKHKVVTVSRNDGATLHLSDEEVRVLQTLFYHTGGWPGGARGLVNQISRVLSDATGIYQTNHFDAEGSVTFEDELPRDRGNPFE